MIDTMNELNNYKPRVVFFGSAEFSLPTLISLCNNSYQVVGVVTQPDKPAGRGKRLTQNIIREWATNHNLPVFQPAKIKSDDVFSTLASLNVDLFVVAAYGKILPKNLLNLPRFGALNVHGSLLPRFRGASPVQAALLAGDAISGVTIMLMDEGMDTGQIIATAQTAINSTDNTKILGDRLSEMGANLLVEILPQWIEGKIKPKPQPSDGVSICRKIIKNDARINWNSPATEIDKMVRAFNPSPVAWTLTKTDSRSIKLFESRNTNLTCIDKHPGDIFLSPAGEVLVCCGENSVLQLTTVQPQDKKNMPASAFINGHRDLLASGLI